ncbi:peptidoglycan N-acetylglucosamine deacetylase [Geomicrobium sp. JCM 19037]|uniref:polysaccharide deacetylase family protein n=1 Tax=Geomicrobium sp. JCM 19037 TaxID=1460634 RepID=UPI00045F39BF|nr:polysaccharide deacetylase family protein [Geomicrobium sp. JCM 19037]GAK02815.1 peptidoglycan N-acetylglucosamine deacetylase [Geomicrobium sp. JCM 19037]
MRKFLIIAFVIMLIFLMHNDVLGKSKAEFIESGEVVWNVHTDKKLIALTFDDGPHPMYTPLILDVLKKHDAKGTFFVIGKHAERYPEILQREMAEGHEIGNHSYDHRPLRGISKDEFMNQLELTEMAIENATGVRPIFFRSMGGYYDDFTVDYAAQEGYRTVMWSWHQDSRDWKRPGVNTIVNNVAPGSTPGDIVLFHDAGGNRSETVKALDRILTELRDEGFEFVTISELLVYSDHEGIPPELVGL